MQPQKTSRIIQPVYRCTAIVQPVVSKLPVPPTRQAANVISIYGSAYIMLQEQSIFQIT
jgi:hypothetical protein